MSRLFFIFRYIDRHVIFTHTRMLIHSSTHVHNCILQIHVCIYVYIYIYIYRYRCTHTIRHTKIRYGEGKRLKSAFTSTALDDYISCVTCPLCIVHLYNRSKIDLNRFYSKLYCWPTKLMTT